MSDLNRVDIIVPVYNVEKYLGRCIDSLIDQTYKNINILLIDDGSKDRSGEICDSYASKNENITVFHKPNGGLSSARNYGVLNSDSEWIVFVDSDDFVEKEYVENLVSLKEQFNADMVITKIGRENEDGSGRISTRDFPPYLSDRENAIFQVYSGSDAGWSACGKLLRKSLLLKYPFPAGYYEDCACMYKIISDSDRIVIGNCEYNYHYIQRSGSILSSKLDKRHFRVFEIADEFESFIMSEYPQLQILIACFYKRAVIQLLNLQKMSWSEYKSIFMKYRPVFRKNLAAVLKEKRLSFKAKVFFILLCGRPEFFVLQKKILNSVRG